MTKKHKSVNQFVYYKPLVIISQCRNIWHFWGITTCCIFAVFYWFCLTKPKMTKLKPFVKQQGAIKPAAPSRDFNLRKCAQSSLQMLQFDLHRETPGTASNCDLYFISWLLCSSWTAFYLTMYNSHFALETIWKITSISAPQEQCTRGKK